MFRFWSVVRHGIAAKMYFLTLVALASLGALVYASIHFAEQTELAAERLYGEGVVGLQQAALVGVLFEQHRRMVEAAPAELDRNRLGVSRAALADLTIRLKASIKEGSATDKWLKVVASEIPMLEAAGMEVLRLAENFAQDKALEVSQGAYGQAANRIDGSLQQLRKDRIAAVNIEVGNLSKAAQSLIEWVILSALLAFVVIGPFGLFIKHQVLSRLSQITAAIQRLSRRDLTVSVPRTKDLDEVGDIARAIEVFKTNAVDLAAAHLQLDAALNNMSQGLVMFDVDERIVVVNGEYIRMYDLSPDFVKPGRTVSELFKHRAERGHLLRDPEQYRIELLARISHGTRSNIIVETADAREISITNQPMSNGGWLSTHEDITERRKADAKISHMALHDGLTNLPNRLFFREQIENRLAHVSRDQKFAVLCLDLDGFKRVNDTLGHPFGDKLLRQVAERMTGCLREGDTIARLGGDEFAILQGALKDPSDAIGLADRIFEVASAPFDLDGQHVLIGVSIGIAVAPTDAADADQLLKNADLALYRAKADGRGTYRFFEPEMDALMQARRTLELDLRKAIVDGEFELFYQPIVNLQRQEVAGFEALLRWNHPVRGLVAPLDFIPLAEETGLIVQIGEWVLREACREATRWPGEIDVAVNLSPAQFKTRNLPQLVVSALAQSGLPAARLELEITESVLLVDNEPTMETLHQLRSLGVRICMDDFGIGYSSLGYLRSFPFDKIKIDRIFVHDLASSADSQAIVRAVVGLGSSLGMTTTGEGVEAQEELDYLKGLGCTEAQGYFLGRPSPASDVLAWMSKHFVTTKEVA